MKVTNRQRGCLIGLAVGDDLGAAIEFRAPGTFKPVTGYRFDSDRVQIATGPGGYVH